MASKKAVAAAVAALYTAAGRNYGPTEADLYLIALDHITDDDLREAVVAIIRGVDFGLRPPSPGLVVETVNGAKRRSLMLDAPAPCVPCDGTGWIEQDDRSMAACSTCGRYVKADPSKRSLPLPRREREPIAIAAAAEKLRAARGLS